MIVQPQKKVKAQVGELVKLSFSAHHTGISAWVLIQHF